MIFNYFTVKSEVAEETVNQGSKFISYIKQVQNTDEIKSFLANLKKLHPFASHICFAYSIIESNGKQKKEKAHDDGEPSGTAGKPLLELLNKKGLTNVILAVVRYFGGVLLGASNLLRAYLASGEKVINSSTLLEREYVYEIELAIDYNEVSKVEKFLVDEKIKTLNSVFAEEVYITIGIPYEKYSEVLKNLNNLLNRKIDITDKGNKFI